MFESEPLQQVDRTFVLCRGRRVSYFSGCDYFRLASHQEVLKAFHSTAEVTGLNVAASRLTSGEHRIYRQLEEKLAAFFDAEDALLVPTGYLGSMVVAQALAGEFSHVLLDERAHPALLDAARFVDCPVLRFQTRSVSSLQSCLRRCGSGARTLVMTDGMFSRTGQVAPLKEYLQILPNDAWLLVDDAHGAGVLGGAGKGTLEHEGVSRERIIQTITLSKAFGTFGGAILGGRRLRKQIFERGHAFAGSTPFPLPLASAGLKALEIMRRDGAAMRDRLFANTRQVKEAMVQVGYELPDGPGPIIPVLPANPRQILRLKRFLFAAEIYPPFVHYPNGPATGYFRFVISSEHTHEQLAGLLECMQRWQQAQPKPDRRKSRRLKPETCKA